MMFSNKEIANSQQGMGNPLDIASSTNKKIISKSTHSKHISRVTTQASPCVRWTSDAPRDSVSCRGTNLIGRTNMWVNSFVGTFLCEFCWFMYGGSQNRFRISDLPKSMLMWHKNHWCKINGMGLG